MNIAIAGTGYVGLITGVCLAHIGHNVVCVDVNEEKINMLKRSEPPIYEEGLEDLLDRNKSRLSFTTDYVSAYETADIIFVAVGTPESIDGSVNLDCIYKVCDNVIECVSKDVIIVIKSTVPIGTNELIEMYLRDKIGTKIKVSVVSNPEFLAQGTAVRDCLHASRIVVGVEDEFARKIMKKIYEPLTKGEYNIPYLEMNRKSAEMIKYASNNFLALKISYINEISNLCEKLGANITDVTYGMSYDSRIGNNFLKAGIGYGGSCFSKDSKSLYSQGKTMNLEMKTIKACIDVNCKQKLHLLGKLINDFGLKNIADMSVAVLGCTFKKGTDDLREAPSIDNIKTLLKCGTDITVYDPVGLDNLKRIFGDRINYTEDIDTAVKDKDVVMIMTEWDSIVNYDLSKYEELMNSPIIYDGRNCYKLDKISEYKLDYISMGRPSIRNRN